MMEGMNPCGGMLMMGFWLILIILAIVALSKWIWGTKTKNTEDDSALSILRDRYARGDISKEEFEDLKNNLN